VKRSPPGKKTDADPILNAIVRTAARLCDASYCHLYLVDGGLLRNVAKHGSLARSVAVGGSFPIGRGSVAGRAVHDRRTVHVRDLKAVAKGEFKDAVTVQRAAGLRTMLATPLLQDGRAIGALVVLRRVVRPFTAHQIALLKTFAEQATIALENARLSRELEARNHDLAEALEQQTATADILRAISSSPTDLHPVLETVVHAAARFCDAPDVAILRIERGVLRMAAATGPFGDEMIRRAGSVEAVQFPISRESVTGRSVVERRTVHVHDLAAEPEDEYPVGRELQRRFGHRTLLATPLLREGEPVGAMVMFRTEVNPFSEKQARLSQAFADQAVIAVENVRLFRELEERTAELTRSVGQLTALGEISRAVSSTLDVETVLQTVVSRASQLAGSDGGAIYEYDDATQEFHIRATHNLDPTLVAALRASPLHRGEGAMGRATETREPVQIADIQVSGAYRSHIRDTLLGAGYRALLSVPLVREDQIIGSLSLNRKTTGEFSAEAVEVLKTFATQSSLAIQNARLFGEIEVKSRQLEAASQHKSEFLANMSHELRTPLNAIIGFSEVLNERMFGDLNEKQDEYLRDIHASGTHLLSLINDILDLSKIEAGRMELELTDFHLPSAIDSALTLVRERATRRGITLVPAVDHGVGQVRADERKVRQVLLNLLSNAIKFTPEGGRIEVRAAHEDGAVEVSVSDTGIGIAPEDQEAVFEEFRQVGSSAARQQGTGLGLTLCRKFIELHRGKIWVTSALGAGSTFTFRLPVRQA